MGTTALGAAYWAVAAHLYGRGALGRASGLVAALILVSSFAQLNLTNTLPRFIPQMGRRAGRLIGYSYGVSAITALVGSLGFVIILPRLSSQWQFVGDSPLLAGAFVVAAVVWGIFALQDSALLSVRRAAIVPLENSVYGVAKLLLLFAIASLLPSDGIFLSWVIPLAIIVPAVNWLIFRRYLSQRESATEVATVRPREVLRFASLDYVGALLAQAYGNLLPLLVLTTLGAAANGSFYIAWTIATGLMLLVTNFATSLLVEGAATPERLGELTRGVLARCLAVTVPGALFLVVAARPVLSIYGHGYAVHSSGLLGLLALAAIPYSFVSVTFSLDRIAGRVGRASVTRFALAVLVLGSSWLLLPRQGIVGVGFAWAGANLVVALVRMPTIVSGIRQSPAPAAPVFPATVHLEMAGSGSGPAGRTRARGPGQHRRRPAGRHRAGAHRNHRMAQSTQMDPPVVSQHAGPEYSPFVPGDL